MYVRDPGLGDGRKRAAGQFPKNGGTRQRGGFAGGRTGGGGGRKSPSEDTAWERGFGQAGAAGEDAQMRRTTASVQEELDALNKERSALVEERLPLLLDESNIIQNKDRLAELNGSIYELNKRIAPLEDELKERKKAKRQALIDSGEYRDANLVDLTWNSAKQGYHRAGYGQESYKDMMGSPNEKEKYEQILSGEDYRFLPDGILEEAISGAANMLGQQARQWTDPRTIADGLTGAGAAMVLGQAGPQVALPEEILTAPGGFITGVGAGSAKRNFEIEAGLAYNELRENGISEDTAKKIARFVGGVNAALELVQTDELVKSIKIFDRSGVTQGFAQQLWQQLVQRMGDVAKETVQEVGQEAVSIGGVQVANKLEKGEWAYDLDEVTDRLKDTAFHSALSFGALNMPAGARNVAGMKVDPFLRGLGEDAKVEVDHSGAAKDGFLKGLYEPDDDALSVSDSDWQLKSIDKRATIKLQNGIACFADNDVLLGRSQKVTPIKGYFDVAMHGAPLEVAFGGNQGNMTARALANLIRHSEGYQGEKIRLLSCSTGKSIDGDYCVAEELANALGVEVMAPTDLLYIDRNGEIYVGKYKDGKFLSYYPNERRRLR